MAYLIERTTQYCEAAAFDRDYVWHVYSGDKEVAIERTEMICGCTGVEAFDIDRDGRYELRHQFTSVCETHL